MSADASASFELEEGDSLASGLDAIASRFAEIASTINSTFASANVQLNRTAVSTQALGASSGAALTLARALSLAANAGRIVATAFSGILTAAARIAPLMRILPDSMGKWVPGVKKVAAEYTALASRVGLVTKAAAALTGRLTVLQAGFAVLEAREVGASRAMALFGTAGALALSKTVSGARLAAGAMGSLGARISGAARGVAGGIGGALGGIGRGVSTFAMITAPMAGLALALGPIGAAAVGVAGAFAAVGKSMNAAAETQSLQASFVTLLGSADAAQKRMAELTKFAASTPFEIPGVVRASRVLETLTHGALSTGAGLRLAGDAAAVSGQPIEELSVHIGRLYDGLMNGRAVGESANRLQELGLISGTTRTRLEELQKSGAKGGAVWAVAAADLMRFSGEMSRQSATWGGIMSNFADGVGSVFRSIGAPIIAGLSPFMLRVNAWLGTLIPFAERVGAIIGGWAALSAQIFADGKMGEALARVGKIAFMEAINFLVAGLAGVGDALLAIMGGVAREFLTLLSAVTTADFWKGLGNALKSAGLALVAILVEGVARVLDALRSVPKIGAAAGRAADKAHGIAEQAAAGALDAGAAAGANLGPLFDSIKDNFAKTMREALDAFQQGRAAAGNVFDTSSARDDLAKWIAPIAKAADDAVKAAAAAANKGGLPLPPGTADTTAGGSGKKGNDVASLQRIGGGGGFSISRADPLLAENRNQTTELKGLRQDVRGLREALAGRVTGGSVPVFGRG